MTPAKRSRARKAWRENQQAQRDRAAAAAEGVKTPTRAKAPRPRVRRRRQPSPVSVQVRLTRTWYVFTAGLMQVITDFEHSGGLAPLLAFWTPEEWARAQAQLQGPVA